MKCYSCKSTKNLIKKSKSKLGIQYWVCNTCNTERCKKYRKTSTGKENVLKAIKKYEANNRQRKKAWGVAQWAEPINKPCVICGSTPTHRHHPDIKKPSFVIFLCPYHHKQAHKNRI